MPVINTSNNTDPEAALARKKRVKMLSTVVTIASLNIVIDILTGKYFFQSYTYLLNRFQIGRLVQGPLKQMDGTAPK